jgi:Eukaryotic-type carbonic anhydrase
LSGDYKVKEGGLIDEFKAVRLEFHWGPTDKTGSEHQINGSVFPLEVLYVII